MSEKWSSQLGFILASIGSAVGLGNLWRFPYIVGQHGLGTFLFAYILSVIFVGIPLMYLEYSLGIHLARKKYVDAIKSLSKYWRFLLIPTLFLFIILSYYIVITGWTLLFLIFQNDLVFSDFGTNYLSIFGMIFTMVLAWFIVRKGLKNGLEKTSKFLVPILFILILILTIYALSIYGVSGINLLLNTDANIYDLDLWIFALTQAFFSLDVGWMVLFLFASYNSELKNPFKPAIITAISDTIIAFLSAVFIFTIAQGLGTEVSQGPTFMFDTLGSFLRVLPFSTLVITALYLSLFIAALTSVISILEVITEVVSQVFDIEKETTINLVTILLVFTGMLSALSYSAIDLRFGSTKILDFLDGDIIGRFSILAISLVVLVLSWSRLADEVIKKSLLYYIKFILVPLLLVVTFSSFLGL